MTRPIWLAPDSVNQRFPSGPVVMPAGWPPLVGTENRWTAPAGERRPIWLLVNAVNHRLPSWPITMLGTAWRALPPDRAAMEYSLTVPNCGALNSATNAARTAPAAATKAKG